MTGTHSGGPCLFSNRDLEMKSFLSVVSPNLENSERAEERIRKEREIVTTPASGNVFGWLVYGSEVIY